MSDKNLNDDLVNLYRGEALDLFKSEKSFLRNLEDSENNKDYTIYLLTNATDTQIKCAIYILFFIFRKEIPLKKSILSEIPKKSIENFLKYYKDPKTIFEHSKEQLMFIILGFSTAFPIIVKQIVHKDG